MALIADDIDLAEPADEHPVVATRHGRVQGLRRDGVVRFLSVPYAAPPVGPRRFSVPEPPEIWTGVRDATVAGPTPPQRIRAFPAIDITPLVGTGAVPGDDYLTLNVWAPVGGGDPRPVMVFIHGGAWIAGHKDASVHDGTAFARSGVVMVAINYRLGVEGFLPIPGVSTNLGLRDQIAALEWVRDNIAAFGGDPGNVTVFGESAGAMSIGPLIGSPLTAGLFRRAILQSGHGQMVRPVALAQRVVEAVAEELGVAPDREGFASRSVEQCLDALEQVQLPTRRIDLRTADGRDPVGGLTRFAPVWGDDVLPIEPIAALASGAGSDVDVLIGATSEEMNLYFVPTGVRRGMIWPLALLALSRVHPRPFALLRAYGLWRYGRTSGAALTDAMTDLVFRGPVRRFAERRIGRTYLYEFSWRSPACGGELGACHGLELPFVFGTLDTMTGDQGLAGNAPPAELSAMMHSLWVSFARDGSLPWEPYNDNTRQVYSMIHQRAELAQRLPVEPFLA